MSSMRFYENFYIKKRIAVKTTLLWNDLQINYNIVATEIVGVRKNNHAHKERGSKKVIKEYKKLNCM